MPPADKHNGPAEPMQPAASAPSRILADQTDLARRGYLARVVRLT